jgi:hypothetical protein
MRLAEAPALARGEHRVVLVAVGGQPDAAAQHRQVAGQAATDAAGFARRQGKGLGRLRIHHQSPSSHSSIIVLVSRSIQ